MEAKVELGVSPSQPPIPRDLSPLRPELEAELARKVRDTQAFWVALGGTAGEITQIEGAV